MQKRRELNEDVKRKYYLDFYSLRAKIYITLPEFQETYGPTISKLIKDQLNKYTDSEIRQEKEKLIRRLDRTCKNISQMKENYSLLGNPELSRDQSKQTLEEEEEDAGL